METIPEQDTGQPEQPEQPDAWNGMPLPPEGKYFFYITRKLTIGTDYVSSDYRIKEYCERGNIFKTEAEAQEILDMILPYFKPINI